MRFMGRLEHSTLEGGAWLLVADDGHRYLLVPPPPGQRDGARVEIEGDVDSDAMSFQMAGPVLKTRRVRAIGG